MGYASGPFGVLSVAIFAIASTANADPPANDSAVRAGGNVLVAVKCADIELVTPDHGLRLYVDGVRVEANAVDGHHDVRFPNSSTPIPTWVSSDVGFVLPPGRYLVEVDATNCKREARVVVVPTVGAASIVGRLAVAKNSLSGPTGTPDGFAVMLGGFFEYGAGASNKPPTAGAYVAVTYEHGALVGAVDAQTGPSLGQNPPFDSGSELSWHFRLGLRLHIPNLAIALGSGLGAQEFNTGYTGWSGVVPVWATITYKPVCDWGVQVLGSFDVNLASSAEGRPMVAAGVIYQSNHACRMRPGLDVR